MSWCDKLASVRTVGITLDWHFASSSAILSALSQILDKLVADAKPQFNMVKHGAFDVSFVTEDGFLYGIDPSRVSVGFQHQMKTKAVSGGPPMMEMLSHPLPFTELLPDVSRRLTEAVLAVESPKTRKITRVGIVSTTSVDSEECPPGIERFIKYLGRPWGAVDAFSFQFLAEIGKATGWTDKCLHILVKPEDPLELLTLTFDWQRTFLSGQTISPDSLRGILAQAERDALAFFEELAEGNRFDEDLIRAAT